MKKYIFISFLFISFFVSAQVAIGKPSVSNTSVSLEFGAGNRGLLLPWVTSAASVTGVVPGTLIYDITDKKIKFKLAASWKDYTVETLGVVNTTLQDPLTELTNAKVSIGTPTATPGILVLEDANKAMVLPKVASPHLNIINPSPGMIVYDTVKKQLAVFDGTNWAFWRN